MGKKQLNSNNSVMVAFSGRAFNCTVAPFQDYIWLGHSSRDMLVEE